MALFLLPVLSFAQTYEVDVHYGFGASELRFNSVPGIAVWFYPTQKRANRFAVSFGIEYSWKWHTIETSEQKGDYPIYEGFNFFFFNYEIDEYKEKLYRQTLQIPILVKYNNDLFYVASGIKIGMSKKSGADISYKGLKTWGYYPQSDSLRTEPLSQGFGKQDSGSYKAKIPNLEIGTLMVALEGGRKLKLSSNFFLTAGIFIDLGLWGGTYDEETSPPIIERVQVSKDSASLVGNSGWKNATHPFSWSIGIVARLSFGPKSEKKHEEQIKEITISGQTATKANGEKNFREQAKDYESQSLKMHIPSKKEFIWEKPLPY